MTKKRRAFMCMGAFALPYAKKAITSLLEGSLEPVAMVILTDGPDDVAAVEAALADETIPEQHSVRVVGEEECAAVAEERWADWPALRQFRAGHPCWRKISDPLLFSEGSEEIIVLDPDLYFPGPFSFEPTPEEGILLMWQRNNCLGPVPAVWRAFEKGYRLAHHVDIGAAQLRADTIDYQWFSDFVTDLQTEEFTRFMHIEAVFWAALAMKVGGGYYDKDRWFCWQRGQIKRVAIRLGMPGPMSLGFEPIEASKCSHLSGPSKWWMAELVKQGKLRERSEELADPSPVTPFVELTKDDFAKEQRVKGLARKLGYQKFVGN
ncbi:hypothetical protein HK107_05720 [Parvularcula sp. ZS-1/3]|uniref:Glycosyl transferase n=1 Tax=Parvularcula mediterranea TaxID=2732508 RepID=A0A7Y3W514_9PROT|nr:hypothetical protein [Parvularcula mediterranea]NNU15817.1 hypothetical protein [Parvularcula mediterranea]